MMNLKKLGNFNAWVPLIVAFAFVGGLLIGRYAGKFGARTSDTSKLESILEYIDRRYVDRIDTDSLMETIYPQLLTALDPHSVYIPAEDLEAVNDELDGEFSGIGISFNMLTDTINVIEIIAGGPAESVGLLPGDRIVSINDTVVAGKGWSNEKVISHLRGPEGTKVRLGIKRESADKILPFEITRGPIPVTSVDASYMIDSATGYMRVNKFGRGTFDEFFSSATELKQKGARTLMIDLRGNGGGYMEMAILMANEFLPRNAPIVSTIGRDSGDAHTNTADGSGSLQDVHVVVLIDEYSASASEIFAGAIQDNDRGIVVGRRSFGKGLVQQQYDLPDHSAIRLTIARYYTPSGRCIQKRYEPGGLKAYQEDLIERYDRGELFSADSVKLDKSITYYTSTGRPVYGGGGIMPDVFVPNDTTEITSYYLQSINGGVIQKYAFHYFDTHRAQLKKAKDTGSLLAMLPSDGELIQDFANFAETQGVPQRWYYINLSSGLIVNQLKALIARSALGQHAYYEVSNTRDPIIDEAIRRVRSGAAVFPVKP